MEDAEDWQSETGLTREEFEKFTRYIHSNNPLDNKNRAAVLGLTAEGIKIAPGAIVRLGDEGHIEDNVLVGPHCSLTSNTHLFNVGNDSFRGKNVNKPIVIGSGSWLAAGAMVTAGTRVGKCNLICANSVVTKDSTDYAILAGTPARQVGRVDPETGALVWFKTAEAQVAQESFPASPAPFVRVPEEGPKSGHEDPSIESTAL